MAETNELVGESAAWNLADSKEGSARCLLYPIRAVRAVAAQAVLGLGDIHSHGVAHEGRSWP